jgi:hypothetical protein
MAKYTINFACGHGDMVKELFGKQAERDRKIAWMESNMVCGDCYRAGQRKADADAPKTCTVHVTAIQEPQVIFAVAGQIEANKDALAGLGFRWQEGIGGVFDMLSVSRPTKRFCVVHRIDSLEELSSWTAQMYNSLKDLGYDPQNALNPIDLEMVRKSFAERTAKAENIATAVAENPKPTRPAWYAEMMAKPGSTWNGKIYPGGRIYISNVEHKLSKEKVAELEAYNKARTAHAAALKQI